MRLWKGAIVEIPEEVQQRVREHRERLRAEREARLAEFARRLGVEDRPDLAEYLWSLERRLEALEGTQ
jgi:hypothetical protein